MNRLLILAALLLASASLLAQTTREEMVAHPEKCGGVYYAYPTTQRIDTPAPKGYQPFYVSHYGRHGSRYLISDNDYKWVMDVFDKAAAAGALTEQGLVVKERLERIWPEAEGRGGELSPLGARQHQAIADRLYKAYPGVFDDEAEVTAASTVVMRCAHSMFNFVDGLKTNNPALKVPMESGNRNMYYLNYHSPESGPYSSHEGPWYQEYRKFKAEKTRPQRMMRELFNDELYVRRNIDPEGLMWGLYWIAVDMQNMETKVGFFDIFSPDELFNLWQVFNFNFYACNSSYPLAKGLHVDNAKNLVRNILETADEYVAAGKHGATLRFGHDGNIIPLAALLQLDNSVAYEADPYQLYRVYTDWRISPMAANIQMTLFRNAKTGHILAKFMLNENEVHIPVATDKFPYYDWEETRAWLRKVIDTPSREFMDAAAQ